MSCSWNTWPHTCLLHQADLFSWPGDNPRYSSLWDSWNLLPHCVTDDRAGWLNQSVQVHHWYGASADFHQPASGMGSARELQEGIQNKQEGSQGRTGNWHSCTIPWGLWVLGHRPDVRRPQGGPIQKPLYRATVNSHSSSQLKCGSNWHSLIPVI